MRFEDVAAPSIVWFRQDLRLTDQAALVAAAEAGPVVAVYVLDDVSPGEDRIGGAQRWWLHHSLRALGAALEAKGGSLVLRRGESVTEVERLAREVEADAVHAIRHYEPWWQEAEARLGERVKLMLHDGNRLARPETLLTGGGTRYRVFTPWWRALQERMPPPKPRPALERLSGLDAASDSIDEWELLPTEPNWATGFDIWTPGEAGGLVALETFLPKIADYHEGRNLPSISGSSRLSAHLHFGEVSPATVWHRATAKHAEPFLREIGWRDFATNIIDQFPDYARTPAKLAYAKMAFRTGKDADSDFAAWTKGRTGYPIVDAGMRQLWAIGWMHNRVRMIAASFLVKHLLIDWRRGERWFWDTLVDADYASNAANWQWVAGTGIDAPLFSRIMAPLTQSEKFGAADYIRKWVPELAALADGDIHDPEHRPSGYPDKLIGHREGRERALAAMRSLRGIAGETSNGH